MELAIIQQSICLEPYCLDSDIELHIITKLKEVLVNNCTKKNGFIIDILRIIEYNDNYISSSSVGGIVFNIIFEAQILKPSVDKIFTGKVCMIIPNGNGIFIDIYGKFQVLIPANKMNGYKFIKSSLSYKKNEIQPSDGGLEYIIMDSIISVKLVGVKYDNKKYACFAELINI